MIALADQPMIRKYAPLMDAHRAVLTDLSLALNVDLVNPYIADKFPAVLDKLGEAMGVIPEYKNYFCGLESPRTVSLPGLLVNDNAPREVRAADDSTAALKLIHAITAQLLMATGSKSDPVRPLAISVGFNVCEFTPKEALAHRPG